MSAPTCPDCGTPGPFSDASAPVFDELESRKRDYNERLWNRAQGYLKVAQDAWKSGERKRCRMAATALKSLNPDTLHPTFTLPAARKAARTAQAAGLLLEGYAVAMEGIETAAAFLIPVATTLPDAGLTLEALATEYALWGAQVEGGQG